MSKYDALTKHLAARAETRVQMSFADLEALLGFRLPTSARTYRPWWANSAHGHVQSRSWLEAGYQSEQVDLEAERLVFVRLNAAPVAKRAGDHPLFGCMEGAITIPDDLDLTAPMYSDDDITEWVEAKSTLLQGRQV